MRAFVITSIALSLVLTNHITLALPLEFYNDHKSVKASEFSKYPREFIVDYQSGRFLKDGEEFQYVSGGIHYFRIPEFYWEDRLSKVKAAGMDAIEMYIPWNFHETTRSNFNFQGQHDVVKFIELAQTLGLLVIVRGFPYADTEWDMGGLPYWLLKSELNTSPTPMKLRTSDQRFISYVYNWFRVILPKLKPLLYSNGGPIIMVQVENEYGSFGNEAYYLSTLNQIMHEFLGDSVVYFTTDGNGAVNLQNGAIKGTLQTCDFGAGGKANTSFAALVKRLPKGPYVNSEFYTGWLDHWGEKHHRVSWQAVNNTLYSMLQFKASVNFYMFHGGTNFKYWAGSNSPDHQITTSYDYDAPLNEAGDTTLKYFKIRETVLKYKNKQTYDISVPKNTTKYTYGPVSIKNIGNMFHYLSNISSNPVKSILPLSYEDLNTLGGFVLYETSFPTMFGQPTEFLLEFKNGVRDSAQIIINRDEYIADIKRGQTVVNITLSGSGISQIKTISVLVRSKGRICFGSGISDSKGISGDVIVHIPFIGAEITLTNWVNYPLDLEKMYTYLITTPKLTQINNLNSNEYKKMLPSFYTGSLNIDQIHDTFIDMSDGGWNSGYLIVNGFNLGYFEPKSGPQLTLYTPLPAMLQNTKSKTLNFFIFESKPRYQLSNIFLSDTANIG